MNILVAVNQKTRSYQQIIKPLIYIIPFRSFSYTHPHERANTEELY